MPGEDWSNEEIDAAVQMYFTMLADEIAGIPVNKAAQNRALQGKIPRSRGSIEFKHQNISAVMLGLGQPWIPGYKPAANFQNALVDGVIRWLDAHQNWLEPSHLRSTAREAMQEPGGRDQPSSVPVIQFGPAPSQRNEPSLIDSTFLAAIGRKYDAAARDARNRLLGRAGEEAVLANERSALLHAGCADLARRVRWTSQEDGDGFGYDIASYEPDGRERLLEVKTTNGWELTPFHISANELAVADECREKWHLVRLWDFARTPRAFTLRPPLNAHLELSPTSFRASFGLPAGALLGPGCEPSQ